MRDTEHISSSATVRRTRGWAIRFLVGTCVEEGRLAAAPLRLGVVWRLKVAASVPIPGTAPGRGLTAIISDTGSERRGGERFAALLVSSPRVVLNVWMRPCTRRIVSAVDAVKATSLAASTSDTLLGAEPPRRTPIRIKPSRQESSWTRSFHAAGHRHDLAADVARQHVRGEQDDLSRDILGLSDLPERHRSRDPVHGVRVDEPARHRRLRPARCDRVDACARSHPGDLVLQRQQQPALDSGLRSGVVGMPGLAEAPCGGADEDE